MSEKSASQEKSYQSQLGQILYDFDEQEVSIHEKGIYCTKNDIGISWDNIKQLYYYPIKHSIKFNFIFTINETQDATFTIIDKNNNIIRFIADTPKEKQVYQLFIDKIFTRQWQEFLNGMNNDYTMLFGKVALNKNFISEPRSTKSGSYEFKNVIGYQNINDYYINSGKIYIEYIDEKGKYWTQCYGEIGYIPNFMIVNNFLNSVLNKNITMNSM